MPSLSEIEHEIGNVLAVVEELDEERYRQELEAYTREQTQRGGTMSLDRQQRHEAVRQWARQVLEGPDGDAWRKTLQGLVEGHRKDNPSPPGTYPPEVAWTGSPRTDQCLREDMKDVLWSVLEESASEEV